MKKVLLFLMLSVLLTSCSEDKIQENSDLDMNDLSFTTAEIPKTFKYENLGNKSETTTYVETVDVIVTSENGTEIKGQIRLTIPVSDNETLVNLEMTTNIFELTELSPDFWLDIDAIKASMPSTKNHGACIDKCEGDDIKRPGWCKAGCWVETVAKAVVAVAAVIVAVS